MVKIFFLFCLLQFSVFADFAEKERHKHSFSAQVGVNGVLSSPSTFGLQLFPFDVSYGYKLFDNNKYSLSTSVFYDNIGVDIDGINFNYRLGQRFDFGFETNDIFIYGTVGIANLFIDGASNQISPVYGFGLARDISHHFAVVTEINFQDIWKYYGHYNILNLSLGFIYSFDV